MEKKITFVEKAGEETGEKNRFAYKEKKDRLKEIILEMRKGLNK